MKRYALVTGASRGIGRAIAIELAKDGCAIWYLSFVATVQIISPDK